ncbi:hypothetical protein [Streptomyces sp. enrichment culture]|uniref:hypothetical protein n=1 Tax=Streptomyces sp. enrichment culture TaxID=1795815 RepID=UPI003F57133D
MRATTTRLSALALALGLLTAGGATLLTPSAAAASPARSAPHPYYHDCDSTYDEPETGVLVGEGCTRVYDPTDGDGVYIRDWGTTNDWLCVRVDGGGTGAVRGHECRPVEKDTW